ncbi:hypothetical protein NHX12_007418 [Muraenolepis orangiensis]|uniref:Zinc finger CCHC domain-containing protein n=1 Tax=Muraenolepis orangiensis TaxID=630683 RepID=A0A9Q0DP35_9TELE|nr:hypothetical protein NHX12_007418 [Muraenolepis orangiensis]
MTEGAGQERTIPRVGLRCTIRFQARAAEERLTARSFFCRGVIMGQLGLTVENVRCIQWNQQEKAFDVTLMDLNIFNRVAETCVKEAGELSQPQKDLCGGGWIHWWTGAGGGPSTLGGAAVVEQEERGEPSVPVVGSVELPPFVTTPPIGPKQARRGSQGVEEGHRKRPKGDGVSGEGLNREGEVEGGGELLVGEQGGAAAVVGGCEEVQAEELLPEGLGLGFDLPPGLFLDGDLIGSPTAPNPLPFSWGEQMESVELDP